MAVYLITKNNNGLDKFVRYRGSNKGYPTGLFLEWVVQMMFQRVKSRKVVSSCDIEVQAHKHLCGHSHQA